MILALINNKGGVGKTTTAVNLAAGLARDGERTLLVDLDAQASASLHLGIRSAPTDVYDALLGEEPSPVPTAIPGLDLLVGSERLAGFDLEVASQRDRNELLQRVLKRCHYDNLILDCPPSLSLITASALRSSDQFLIPVTPHYLALEGLASLLRFAAEERARCLGLVLTMVDYRTRVTKEIVDLLRQRFADEVLSTEIRTNVRLAEAASFGQSIFEYDARSSGARLYAELTQEVKQRCLAPHA